jgi:hypothetical protein
VLEPVLDPPVADPLVADPVDADAGAPEVLEVPAAVPLVPVPVEFMPGVLLCTIVALASTYSARIAEPLDAPDAAGEPPLASPLMLPS